ncbi:MAG: SPOR domain-containing protein [Muribaculaceae bacterium]|nr:SPOR domain-containing protein [Muribaculaceae bacterium]
MLSMIAMAQTNPDIVNRLNQSGQVVVDAPQELITRSNSSIDRPNEPKKTVNKKTEKSEDDKFADMDDERDQAKEKDKDKVKSDTPKQPKRERTTQQTIQGRSVGYRIQAYSDNNYRTAKASTQARARAIAMKFPQYRSYISYNAPTWRLRLGDFKTQGDAQAALSRIRSVFPNYAREMTIVRDHINVWQ